MKRTSGSTGTISAQPPQINEDLCQCPICLDVMHGKILCCPEGHGTCEGSCFDSLPSPKTCPQCRKRYTSRLGRAIMVEQIIASSEWLCKYGCGQHCMGAQMLDHLGSCAERPFPCPAGCGASMPLSRMAKHMMQMSKQGLEGHVCQVWNGVQEQGKSFVRWSKPKFWAISDHGLPRHHRNMGGATRSKGALLCACCVSW